MRDYSSDLLCIEDFLFEQNTHTSSPKTEDQSASKTSTVNDALRFIMKKKRKNSYSTIEFGSNDFKWPSAIRTKGTFAPASRTRKRLSVTLGGTEEFDIGKIPFKSTERSMTKIQESEFLLTKRKKS